VKKYQGIHLFARPYSGYIPATPEKAAAFETFRNPAVENFRNFTLL
jgi:hypothetical protein